MSTMLSELARKVLQRWGSQEFFSTIGGTRKSTTKLTNVDRSGDFASRGQATDSRTRDTAQGGAGILAFLVQSLRRRQASAKGCSHVGPHVLTAAVTSVTALAMTLNRKPRV